MSLLVDYESSEDDECVTSTCKGNVGTKQHSPQLSPSREDQKQDQNIDAVDFFGISNNSDSFDDEDEDVECKKKKIDIKETNSAEGHMSEIEIPSSSFWGKAPTQNQLKYEWKTHLHDAEDDLQTGPSVQCNMQKANKRHLCPKERTVNRSDHHRQKNTHSNTPLSQSKPVKFYIHHKIKPHLHQPTQSNSPSANKLNLQAAHISAINSIAWNEAQYSHLLLSCSMDKTISIWNAFSGPESAALASYTFHDKAVKKAVWCCQGRQLISASYDKTCRHIDVETGKLLQTFDHPSFVTCVHMHPVQKNMFLSGCNNQLLSWDMRQSRAAPVKKFNYKDVFGQVQDITFIQNGQEFVTCNDMVTKDSSDRNIMTWDFRSGVVLSNQVYQERYTCTAVLAHPTEADFVAQSQGNYLAMFSTIRPYKMNKCKRFDSHKVMGYNIGCDFSRDGKYLYSGSSDGKIYVYDYLRGKCCRTLNVAKNCACLDVKCHPVLPRVVAACTWNGGLAIFE